MSNPSARLTVIDYEPIPGITAEQKSLATRRIAERARDVDDARLLLAIVFEPPREFIGINGRRNRRRGKADTA